MKRALFALLLFPAVLFAQGFRFDGQPISTTQGSSVGTFYTPLVGTVTICAHSPGNTPSNCAANKIQTYTDLTLATPCSTNAQVVLNGTNTCVSTSDSQGNWGFYGSASVAQFDYTLTIAGTTYGPYTASSAGGSLLNSSNVWPLAQTFTQAPTLGTSTTIGEDSAAPGTAILGTSSGGTSGTANLGDAANPLNSINTLNAIIQNQTTTGTVQANNQTLTGDPLTAPAGACNYGGISYTSTCPSGLSSGATACIKVNCGGTLYVFGLVPWSASTVLPTPPSTATVFGNLQLSSGNPGTWTLCNANNSCSAGTSSGIGTASFTFGVTSPSQSNAALEFINSTGGGTVNTSGTAVTWQSGVKFSTAWTGQSIKINGTNYTISSVTDTTHLVLTGSAGTQTAVSYASTSGWNTLAYRHLGNPSANPVTGISNMLEDWWVYVTPGTGVTGYEFDPDLGTGTYAYKASLACYAAAGEWYLYDSQNHTWDQTTATCNFNGAGANAWHHLQLWVTYDQTNHQYTYKAFVVDGTTVFSVASPPSVGPTFNACGPGCSGNTSLGSNVNIEMQIDNGSSSSSYTSLGYYDLYNLTVW